jgi:trigger factor
MQITETLSEGLKRQYKIVLPAKDLADRLSGELANVAKRANIPGFRPGKVPQQHLRRVYGKSVMADVLQNAVNEVNRKIVDDNGLKLAFEPAVNFPQEQDKMEAVMEARGDLEYTVALEVLPKIEVKDHSSISLEKQVVEVPASDVEDAIKRMAEPSRPFADKGEKAKAASGDRVTVDFVGRIDGVEFEGGKGEGIQVVLGSNTFIPGFEDQLMGVKKGDAKLVKVTFPTNYQAANLAGREAEFDVVVMTVEAPGELTINDELAKQYGMEDLGKLKDAVKISLGQELDGVSRRKLKRKLLDSLDGLYTFDLPPTLLDQEFNSIWNNVTQELQAAGKTFEDEGSSEAEARVEYQTIAARRVRLGLVLAEIGEKAGVQVTDDEVSQGLGQRARQFPGQEKAVWDFYRKNPQALAEIRAPIFEEKVVDHILGQVKITDKAVSKEDLMNEDDDIAASSAKPAKKAAKKVDVKADAGDAPAAEKKAAPKKATKAE